jgi:enoyl-CoA hydratase
MSEHIRYDVADGIGTITIDRPEKRNAMTFLMLADFIDTVRVAGADDDARVLIVTGSGGAFCAGTDLADLNTVPGESRGVRGEADQTDVWWPLAACPKPVIAAVDGAAVGMGAEFTSQCDVRIASTRARFAWNFVHRGLVPDTGAGTWLLPRIIGLPAALRLLYSGDFLGADEALELGYVSRVVEPDQLEEAAREEARRFGAGSPFSQRLIKDLVYRGLERDLGDHMRHHVDALQACFRSEDHKEGVAAFLERREARFIGR